MSGFDKYWGDRGERWNGILDIKAWSEKIWNDAQEAIIENENSGEPLAYLSRKQLQFNIMKNIDRKIKTLNRNNSFRFWWDRSVNWVKVQELINGGTRKAGSTSSGSQCQFIGLDPNSSEIKS